MMTRRNSDGENWKPRQGTKNFKKVQVVQRSKCLTRIRDED